jgi:hypothetical protein
MPRYNFNVIAQNESFPDVEGQEVADLIAAYNEAIAAARDILADLVREGKPIDHRRFEITDEAGEVLLVVPFINALVR